MANNKKEISKINIVLSVVAALLLILLIVLIIYFVRLKNGGFSDQKETSGAPNAATASVETTEPAETKDSDVTSGESSAEQTEETQETTEEVTSEQVVVAPTTQAILPEKVYGKWDLSTLDTKMVPYGNNPDDTNSCGQPNGVFWYGSKWGQYKADFISDNAYAYKNGETSEKLIYLTMDCGFDNPYTEQILDTLKAKNVKATFFVTTMFYDARPDLIQRMIQEGHRVGSHSINHYDMTTLSVAEQEAEIMDVVNKLKKDYDYDCYLFRFPLGNFSDEALGLVENLGLKSVFWSYAYNDYSATQPEVQPSYERAVRYLHPGAIYLLHASSSTNNAFLGQWIDEARAQGYEFGGVYPVD